MKSIERGTKATIALIVGVLAAWTSAMSAFAVDIIDDPVQIDERVTQVIQATNSLCWEMHRYHQQQPDYAESYRVAKGIWSKAGQLHDTLQAGPVETEVLRQQVTEMSDSFFQIGKKMLKWESGDRSMVPASGTPTQRTVVRPGVEVDIPFIGFRVGGPQVVVTDDGPRQLQRIQLHPNSRGSKRSLERELAAVNVAMSYLMEDAAAGGPQNSPPAGNAPELGPVPHPTAPDATEIIPQRVVPLPAKKPDAGPVPK